MMMVEASDGAAVALDGSSSAPVDYNDVLLNLDDIWRLIEESPDSQQGGRSEDLPIIDSIQGELTSAVQFPEDDSPGFGEHQHMPHSYEDLGYWKKYSESEQHQSSPNTKGNGPYYAGADDSLQNASSSCQIDREEAPIETFSDIEPFTFGSMHDRESLYLNAPEKDLFDTSSYGEPSTFHSTNGALHKRDSMDFGRVNHEGDVFGSALYSGTGVSRNYRNNIGIRPTDVLSDLIGGSGTYNARPGQLYSIDGIGMMRGSSSSMIPRNNNVSQAKGEIEEKDSDTRTFISPGRSGEIPLEICDLAGHDWFSVSENHQVRPPSVKMERNSLKMENDMINPVFFCHDWPDVDQISENLGGFSPSSFEMEASSVKMENELPNSAFVGHDLSSPVHHFLENPGILPTPLVKVEMNSVKVENKMPRTYQGVRNNTVAQNVDDDCDVCILEDMSAPARPKRAAMNAKRAAMNAKLAAASQLLTSRNHGAQMATAHSRIKSNDERAIFRVALQDLTQPKSEATPPDGLLSVPLLKHQRIALSWMVNKETKSACCSGGILADDQGLGKTVSTIALILKERPASSKGSMSNEKQSETETLNLDDDDDDDDNSVSEAKPQQVSGCPINGGNNSLLARGRPSGGTLIVCPTSVLRQWSEELHNKVTREADLSVLVYYGSNRTKDHLELAKYDVVVTTYAIVSMEVPKQPVAGESENPMDFPLKELSSSGKKKSSEYSCKSKKRKGNDGEILDGEILEKAYGPLAQVGWFRVVLDEAQSIKNHRTQVARACWGLRAKRRWCLSGTPIQNAIDDLYSYFRFLRHEPYAVFRTFCEQLKVPIHRNPRNGYKKLQAVLKTIMLRRTKGTFIDGEPIINLPPKTIELKKIDFSKEERDFYCRLEAESRAQFAEYAAAGTVKQNYVNILLMLLRLRQACDHPLLVKGFGSSSKMTSSIEMAKKISKEKQNFLLSCLEASLAICGICNDPPEDAVVTLCGHVFCHQCICEHLIGDSTQCPSKKCKTHLSMACVFSMNTLRIALSDQPSTEDTASCTDHEVAEVSELQSSRCPQDSSKIKAALDLLLSVSSRTNFAAQSESSQESCASDRDNNVNSDNSGKVMTEKAIVFSQWTGMLDLLEACLKSTSIEYRRLDGTMPVAARDRAVKDFNSLPQVSVMIMSLKAASLGLNMVAACNVLLLDLWWNPTTEDQAIDRAHRIGQTRPVSVFRLTVKDTVEDRILALQQRKRRMVASAFGEDESRTRQTRLTVDDLKYLFRVD
ncbi:SNF2 domain-containing protein / helicase domain-containing protein / zinc finger protein-related [Striga hermonthica]|uniref:SNF2 domain-containing protein / helicase domain-containing protein / zinc finger protein-related n=1 Tax=Striga hermonthica TaxID=68872 RepID=A0A9N7N5P7_STRHE|nr:SNF2 domain-containing protein / helicase domain-containing protein / zinc finger protein-related [Striga hermonthica]